MEKLLSKTENVAAKKNDTVRPQLKKSKTKNSDK